MTSSSSSFWLLLLTTITTTTACLRLSDVSLSYVSAIVFSDINWSMSLSGINPVLSQLGRNSLRKFDTKRPYTAHHMSFYVRAVPCKTQLDNARDAVALLFWPPNSRDLNPQWTMKSVVPCSSVSSTCPYSRSFWSVIEEKLLWRAYRKSRMLFRTVPFPTPYGLPFPNIGGSQPHPKTAITIISGKG